MIEAILQIASFLLCLGRRTK